MTNNTDSKVRDYLAERDEQRFGVEVDELIINVDDLIERRHKAVFDKLESLKADFPEMDPVSLERMAVTDCLFDLGTKAVRLRLYADAIARLLDSHVEDCGTDVPPDIELLQLSMWHLSEDCEAFEEEFDSVGMMASALIKHPRA